MQCELFIHRREIYECAHASCQYVCLRAYAHAADPRTIHKYVMCVHRCMFNMHLDVSDISVHVRLAYLMFLFQFSWLCLAFRVCKLGQWIRFGFVRSRHLVNYLMLPSTPKGAHQKACIDPEIVSQIYGMMAKLWPSFVLRPPVSGTSEFQCFSYTSLISTP